MNEIEVRDIVNLVCNQGYFFKWDETEKCYLLFREKDDKLVAKIWIHIEVCEDVKTKTAFA